MRTRVIHDRNSVLVLVEDTLCEPEEVSRRSTKRITWAIHRIILAIQWAFAVQITEQITQQITQQTSHLTNTLLNLC